MTIRAVAFDLDGTLVETEVLKGRSYAQAVLDLRPDVDPRAVEEAYAELVGRSREEVVAAMMRRFGLESAAAARTGELGVATPEAAFTLMRTHHYERMLTDAALIRSQEYPAATALLRRLRGDGYRTAMATMSYRDQVGPILAALGLEGMFDVIVARDDVRRPKPDPEIYRAVLARLGLGPAECLAIEDSLPGVQSALAAGLPCVASTSHLTRAAVHASGVLPPELIVDDASKLERVVLGVLRAARASGVAS